MVVVYVVLEAVSLATCLGMMHAFASEGHIVLFNQSRAA